MSATYNRSLPKVFHSLIEVTTRGCFRMYSVLTYSVQVPRNTKKPNPDLTIYNYTVKHKLKKYGVSPADHLLVPRVSQSHLGQWKEFSLRPLLFDKVYTVVKTSQELCNLY